MRPADAVIRPGPRRPRVGRFARWLLATAALVGLIAGVHGMLAPELRLGVNVTDSLPGLLYLVRRDALPVTRGEAVAFRPPANRFYPERMVFVKQVVGLPGDRVTRAGRDFFVNDRYVATAKPRARSGAPLEPGPAGVIPDGRYFVWTPHPDSFDSRYADIGWIPATRLVGRAHRLL